MTIQEEDFVTATYNRVLLRGIPSQELSSILQNAISWLQDANLDDSIRNALLDRLNFREDLLRATLWIEQDEWPLDLDQTPLHWQGCSKHLDAIEKSRHLGEPVSKSFSVKLQRKLASQVPPRPIVEISFETALSYFKKLCQDAIDVLKVLDYHGSNNMFVCVLGLPMTFACMLTRATDIYLVDPV
jgi:hypothetical protein